MTMYKRNARPNNNQLLTIYQGVHITHLLCFLLMNIDILYTFTMQIQEIKNKFNHKG